MRTCYRWELQASLILLFVSSDAAIAAVAGLQRVASGVSSPMFITQAPGDSSRLFIAERGGSIRILDLTTGALASTPFLTMSGITTGGSEGGFLGLAFHPDYLNAEKPGFGKFYVKITTAGSDLTVRIREFTVSGSDPNLANPDSMRELLTYTNPAANHVGGWIGFSPNDGYLYIANGDGGNGYDQGTGHTEPDGNAQDRSNNWLGKMLRIDPIDPDPDSGPNYAIPSNNPYAGSLTLDNEIWSYGLRNPFRASFDRITGDLWIGDVGQDTREEVNFQPASSAGGENYGWRFREGSIETPGSVGEECPGCIEPVYDYERPISDPLPLDPAITAINQFRGTTVIGGYIYRGPDPSLQGQYIFLDRSGDTAGINYWMFNPDDPHGTIQNIDSLMIPDIGSASGPVSMGEDAAGNLYIAYFSGAVYRIATNESLDGDYNLDGYVDAADYTVWRNHFGEDFDAADGDGSGEVDEGDYAVWRQHYGESLHDGLGGGGLAAIPEPASVALVAAMVLFWLPVSSRRARMGSCTPSPFGRGLG